MNEEIKLILKTMETFTDNSLKIENTKVTTLCLTKNENKLLLNYITNLQEENQKLNKIIDELEKYAHYRIENFWNDEEVWDFRDVLEKLAELKKEVE